MTLRESVFDALVEVRQNRGRTVLQTLGVILGVASLVAVQGLTDAGRRQSLKFFSELGGLKKILVVNKPIKTRVQTAQTLASKGLTWADVESLRKEVGFATRVDPIAVTSLMVRTPSYLKERDISGLTPDYPSVYNFYPARGRFLIEDDLAAMARVVVLGDTAARLYFGNEDPLGKTLFLGDVGFRVVGVMRRKEFYFNEGDRNALEWMNRMTIIPITAMYARFTGDPDKKVAYVNVMVDQVKNNRKAAEQIKTVLLRRHGGVQDFEVINREERLKQQEAEGAVFDITFMVTGIVSLIVGGIVIMNIMLASLRERIREVGVRKAIGAKGVDVALQFLVESVLVTSIGGLAGLPLGMAFASGITALLGQPAIITPKMALVSVVASVSVGLLFGLYPALKASRLNPVEALRYE
ncbi:MAG TPA: ABC transporter permease [Candidatus Polarisedimenticolia bacterium]|nr:ABC transporter permease [Candidatus Polarisedimenticolia bacterium]